MLWRSKLRYVRRPIASHIDLALEYSSETISRATGRYAETLVLMGLGQLGLRMVARNASSYKGIHWTETAHDLDFIFEDGTESYGVEVKNSFDYIPRDEMDTKLAMCQKLRLHPLFIVRIRDKLRWQAVQSAGGLLYMFKSKIFPPGHERLAERIWQEMRLPVAVWDNWPQAFYSTISNYLKQPGIISS